VLDLDRMLRATSRRARVIGRLDTYSVRDVAHDSSAAYYSLLQLGSLLQICTAKVIYTVPGAQVCTLRQYCERSVVSIGRCEQTRQPAHLSVCGLMSDDRRVKSVRLVAGR